MAYTTLSDFMKATCDAIRSKLGTANIIAVQDIPNKILAIPSVASDIKTGSFIIDETFSNYLTTFEIDTGLDEIQYFIWRYVYNDEAVTTTNYNGGIGYYTQNFNKQMFARNADNSSGGVYNIPLTDTSRKLPSIYQVDGGKVYMSYPYTSTASVNDKLLGTLYWYAE